jgi:hypothetical protein
VTLAIALLLVPLSSKDLLAQSAPLGTFGNPVRAGGPPGQFEYLQRLRCPDGSTPVTERRASSGTASDGHIVDIYQLRCADGSRHSVAMDMYHGPERERRTVAPFTLLAEHPARLATGCPPRVSGNADSSASYVFAWYEVETPARPIAPLPESIPGPRDGFVDGTFVVGKDGRVLIETFTSRRREADLLELGRQFAATLRYEPALHHAGCAVPMRTGFMIEVRKAPGSDPGVR